MANPNIERILRNSGLEPKVPRGMSLEAWKKSPDYHDQLKNYNQLKRLLYDLDGTKAGQKILNEMPNGIEIRFEFNKNSYGAYHFGSRSIRLSPLNADNVEEMSNQVVTLGHEMTHAIQDKNNLNSVGETESAFAVERASELETRILDAELGYQLKYEKKPSSNRYKDIEDTPEVSFYKECLDHARKENPKANDTQIKKSARTQMAKAYWSCDLTVSSNLNIQESILEWNLAYNSQAIRNTQPNQSFFGKIKNKIKSAWNSFKSFFTGANKEEQNLQELREGLNKKVSAKIVRNMDVNLSDNYLTRLPDTICYQKGSLTEDTVYILDKTGKDYIGKSIRNDCSLNQKNQKVQELKEFVRKNYVKTASTNTSKSVARSRTTSETTSLPTQPKNTSQKKNNQAHTVVSAPNVPHSIEAQAYIKQTLDNSNQPKSPVLPARNAGHC